VHSAFHLLHSFTYVNQADCDSRVSKAPIVFPLRPALHFSGFRIGRNRSATLCAIGLSAAIICPAAEPEAGAKSPISYGSKGLEFRTRDDNTSLWLGLRFQVRFTDLIDPEARDADRDEEFSLNRGRIKGGGHLFRPWLDIYSEYDFVDDRLLDFRVSFTLKDWIHVRGGQWKSDFSRERIDSSGKQQFVERSIANYWFTVDRQLGGSIFGRLQPEGKLDSSYWIELLSANGRGGSWENDDYMILGRYQWNPLGRVLPFSQSDLEQRENPAASVAVAGVFARSAFTRYSSSGGGQLPGYEGGESGQYEIRQLLLETAYQGYGASYQQELHWKEIDDRIESTTRRLWGGYVQGGYFLHESWPVVPKPFELAGRFALVDPDLPGISSLQMEYALAANWFFNGHRNKITIDLSYVELDIPGEDPYQARFRVQWDVSI